MENYQVGCEDYERFTYVVYVLHTVGSVAGRCFSAVAAVAFFAASVALFVSALAVPTVDFIDANQELKEGGAFTASGCGKEMDK